MHNLNKDIKEKSSAHMHWGFPFFFLVMLLMGAVGFAYRLQYKAKRQNSSLF